MRQVQALDKDKRPAVVAIDLPKSLYPGTVGRDEYMAESITMVCQQMPAARILIVSGNSHVLKKLDWEDYVPNKTGSMRSYLDELIPGVSALSIGQLIDCDFTRRFGHLDASVAVDCDENFRGWNIGITSALAMNPAESYELIDGVIIY